MGRKNSTYSKFPERLGVLYTQNGESQRQAADALGTTKQNVNNWANGKNEPNFQTLVSIAKHYNVSTDYLLGLTDVKTVDKDLQAVCDYVGLSEKAVEKIASLNQVSNIISLFIESNEFEKFLNLIMALVKMERDESIQNHFTGKIEGVNFNLDTEAVFCSQLQCLIMGFVHNTQRGNI